MKRLLAALVCHSLLLIHQAPAGTIQIENPGLELPDVPDVTNVSFDGVHGGAGKVPGWSSNEPGNGGAIRVDEKYPGRTGNNVMYLHGTGEQNFYTAEYNLGVDLQGNTTYVLSFDVVRWQGITKDDTVVFRAGLYMGPDWESRVPLKEYEGRVLLVDHNNNPIDKVRVTIVYTSGEVQPGTKFWIGGDAAGNALDINRPHFDNFSLDTETR